jgi:hypothetical protein
MHTLLRLVDVPFKAYWLRDAPAALTFNNSTFRLNCIYVFYIYLRTKQRLVPRTT